jgi:hypothetical protein
MSEWITREVEFLKHWIWQIQDKTALLKNHLEPEKRRYLWMRFKEAREAHNTAGHSLDRLETYLKENYPEE